MAGVLLLATLAPAARACPFCSQVSQTIRQEMEVMDAVVIAEATEKSIPNLQTGEVLLTVTRVLKGDEHVRAGQPLSVVYFGEVPAGRRFMLSGVNPPEIQWSALPLTEESEKYVLTVTELPDDGLERLKYFQQFLQSDDSMLSRDSYDEFAITPYPIIQSLKPFMNRQELISWVQDPEMPADRKRLYYTMLGVCGEEADAEFLKKMITSTQPSSRAGLDALVACYLILAGEKGLPLINELFLANDQSPYADTYSAIMSLRFHGTEADKIARSELLKSMHLVLERKDLADLVIPDLARWGDWSQIDRLVQLFMDADEDNNWVRVPVINYLRACPLPEAEVAMEKLKEVDPESVRRASSFFSVPIPKAPEDPQSSYRVPVRDGERLAYAVPLTWLDNSSFDGALQLGGAAAAPALNRTRWVIVSTIAFATAMLLPLRVLAGGGRLSSE